MPNIPEESDEELVPFPPSQLELFKALDRMHGEFNDVGDHVALLLLEWQRVEMSEAAREFARVAPDVVMAIYWLEVALFRVELERHL